MKAKWRPFDACRAVHPENGLRCEQERGHDGDHYYSVWAVCEEDGTNYPQYPVAWAEASR